MKPKESFLKYLCSVVGSGNKAKSIYRMEKLKIGRMGN